MIPEEKPEPKSAKDPADTPRSRTKNTKRSYEPIRNTSKYERFEEPRETVIITEEIRDPWDREQIEKVRIERQKQKNKYENIEEGEKQKTRKKSKVHKKEQHRTLQKENSNGSSNAEDDQRIDEKPIGFTTVQGKTKTKKKIVDMPTPIYYGNTLDNLDEISLSGPRPDGKDIPRHSNRSEYRTKSHPRKKLPFQQEKLIMDTPTSPHAIAAAIVEAALVKSQQKKKSKKNEKSSGSGPNSPSGLSASSRSSSYSSIVGELTKLGERARSATPSGLLHGKCYF